MVIVDQDGSLLINYLDTVFVSPDESQQLSALMRHRTAVISNLFDTRVDSSAHDKAQWSARYHNFFVGHHFPGDDELVIPGKDPGLEFSMLSQLWPGPAGR